MNFILYIIFSLCLITNVRYKRYSVILGSEMRSGSQSTNSGGGNLWVIYIRHNVYTGIVLHKLTPEKLSCEPLLLFSYCTFWRVFPYVQVHDGNFPKKKTFMTFSKGNNFLDHRTDKELFRTSFISRLNLSRRLFIHSNLCLVTSSPRSKLMF